MTCLLLLLHNAVKLFNCYVTYGISSCFRLIHFLVFSFPGKVVLPMNFVEYDLRASAISFLSSAYSAFLFLARMLLFAKMCQKDDYSPSADISLLSTTLGKIMHGL